MLEGKSAAAAKAAAVAAAEKNAAAADDNGRFVVQVGAFAEADKAREVRQKLDKAGLKSYTQVLKTSEASAPACGSAPSPRAPRPIARRVASRPCPCRRPSSPCSHAQADVTLLDWIAVALLVVSMLFGLVRGLVFEVISLAGWVAAFFCAQWLADDVAQWLPFGDPAATWRYAAAFVLVFVAVAFAVGLVAAITRKLIVVVGLRPVDRILGAAFGAARGVVALLALGVMVHLLALGGSVWWHGSQSAIVLDAALQGLKPTLPEKLASYLP